MTAPAGTAPAVLVVADPDGEPGRAIVEELAWQGYRAELRAPETDLAAAPDFEDWEFVILDLATAERLPFPGERPYRIVLVPAGHPDDAVRALTDLGASAVLDAPPHRGLLAATLLSLCRRLSALPSAQAERPQLRSGDEANTWRLDTTAWTLACPGGGTASLTRTETSFLRALAESPGDAVARSRLIADMGHSTDYYDGRRLDTFVSRLRQKIAAACGQPLPLRSIHAYGYAFAATILVD
ncbi:MAG: winged helix-turn-helix domain-containing protein [Ignavibacteria bacterium]